MHNKKTIILISIIFVILIILISANSRLKNREASGYIFDVQPMNQLVMQSFQSAIGVGVLMMIVD